jgi:tetratricopeptide (TPR) repeat protein/tRNA A-37 threonylcarbamoyl transferase component Bud32
MPPASDKVKAVFLAALDIATPAERAAYLDAACADDYGLRPFVEALLRAHDQHDYFLDHPPAQLSAAEWEAATPREPEQPGAVVAGRYRLLEPVGEGGMGTVWLAEQTEPVRRRVALKLIKPGLGSKAVVGRFEAERQALALMDHPGIARVLDGGTTEAGRPFFVMEYVQGVPLTQYCAGARLGVIERLQLFVQVCQAVQHAHQKGVIHRDLKPSNILVAVADGVPVPKVIDFGLAKALHEPLTDNPQETAHGVLVGTPLYMSPEQAGFDNPDVDTRADVYALGVVLYELLTGTTPLERDRVKNTPWPEVVRRIREEEPPRPSSRLGAAPPGAVRELPAEPRRLARQLRGELDWIVLKCLEKDRARRYETANGLARDVQRFLADEVVEARPPGTAYRLRKWLRKYRGPVVAAGLFLLALLGGMAGTAWGLVRTNEALAAEAAQRREAVEQRGAAVEQSKRAVRAEALATQRLKQVSAEHLVLDATFAFLVRDMLGHDKSAEQPFDANFLVLRNNKLTVREVLDRAADGVGKRFANKPNVEAAVRLILAETYRMIGEYELALPHAERAVALQVELHGAGHAETLFNKHQLAVLCLHLGKNDRAEQLSREVLRAAADQGGDHVLTRHAKMNLASAYLRQNKLDQAGKLNREVLDAQAAALGPDHPDVLACKNNLATVYLHQNRPADAEPLLRAALEARPSVQEPDHPRTLSTRNNLATVYYLQGRHDKATPLFEEVLNKMRTVQGDGHPETIRAAFNLAMSYRASGRLADAEQAIDEWWPRCRARIDLADPITRQGTGVAQGVYARLNKLTRVEALHRDLAEAWKARAGPGAAQYAYHLAIVGDALLRQTKWADAEKALRESLAVRAKAEPEAWTTFYNRACLGVTLDGLRRFDESGKHLVAGYEGLKRRVATIPPGDRQCLRQVLQWLVSHFEALGPPEEAARWRKELANLPAP